MNTITIIGNLGQDPTSHTTQNSNVCKFSLASREGNETMWIDVEAWGKTAEIAQQYLKKGSKVCISGRLKLNTWEHEGQKYSRHKVVCERFEFAGGKDDSQQVNDAPTLHEREQGEFQDKGGLTF